MTKCIQILLCLGVTFSPSCISALAPDDASKAEEILRFIDKGRTAETAFETVMEVSNEKKGSAYKYKLVDNGKDKSILYFLDDKEKGQRILATEDETWFFTNRTKRAIKIPSIQKLFGDASIGDIARLRFAKDYETRAMACSQSRCELSLESINSQSTYAAVTLNVDAQNWLPISAELYAASGKQLKSMRFTSVRLEDSTPVIEEWLLHSPGKPEDATKINASSFALVSLPSVTFTKSYLLMSN